VKPGDTIRRGIIKSKQTTHKSLGADRRHSAQPSGKNVATSEARSIPDRVNHKRPTIASRVSLVT
jgi:hypothetical protein